MLKKNLFVFYFLFFPFVIQGCFNPVDSFAVEVLLNKAGISYDLSFFEKKSEDEVKREDGAIIYLSHFDSRVAVVLSEVNQKLSVKVQIPTKEIETKEGYDLVPAVDIDPEKFNWKEAIKAELVWLRENKIISGLGDEDIEKIYAVSERGKAGYNSRILWEKRGGENEYTWLPYNQTDNPVLLKISGCGGFSISSLPKRKIVFMPPDDGETCKNLCGDGFCQEITCMAIGCPCPESPQTCPQDCAPNSFNLPNPASLYCQKLGYKLEIRKDKEGNEYGVCIFPDGKECDEWAFFREECGKEYKKDFPEKKLDIEIEKENNFYIIKQENIRVKTKEKIIIENNSLQVETPQGKIPINILPTRIVQIVLEREVQEIKEISLKTEKEKPIYEIRSEKREKFLKILPVKIPLTTFIDATSGSILKLNKPLLFQILDIFSF